MSVQVRPAVADDAAALGRVHADAWHVAYADLFEADHLTRAVEQRRGGWAGRFLDPDAVSTTLLVATVEGQVAALLEAGPTQAPDVHEVLAFYAHPDHWGTGVAASLMRSGLKHLRSAGGVEAVLWTLADAARARRFYARSGWQLTGEQRTRDFGDGRERGLVQYRRSLRGT